MLLEFPLRGFKHDSQHGDGLSARIILRWGLPVQAFGGDSLWPQTAHHVSLMRGGSHSAESLLWKHSGEAVAHMS